MWCVYKIGVAIFDQRTHERCGLEACSPVSSSLTPNLFSQTYTKCRSYWMKEQDRNQHRQGLRMTVPVGNATIILFFVFICFWFAPVFHFSWCMMTQERNALTLFLHQVSLASVTVVSVFSPLLSTVQSVEQIVSRNCFWDKWSDEILCNCWPCILYDSWWLCCDYNDI